jgi:hypothetical protein
MGKRVYKGEWWQKVCKEGSTVLHQAKAAPTNKKVVLQPYRVIGTEAGVSITDPT